MGRDSLLRAKAPGGGASPSLHRWRDALCGVPRFNNADAGERPNVVLSGPRRLRPRAINPGINCVVLAIEVRPIDLDALSLREPIVKE